MPARLFWRSLPTIVCHYILAIRVELDPNEPVETLGLDSKPWQPSVPVRDAIKKDWSLLDREQVKALYTPVIKKKCKKSRRTDVRKNDPEWTKLHSVENKITTCARWCREDAKCKSFALFWTQVPPADGKIAYCNHCASSSMKDGGDKWYWYGVPREPELDILRNLSTKRRNGKPLALCEGPCEKDTDCEGDLKCFKRRKGWDSILGCGGRGLKQFDYCYQPYTVKGIHRAFTDPDAVKTACQDNDEGAAAYLKTFGVHITRCTDPRVLEYCDHATKGAEMNRQCALTCGYRDCQSTRQDGPDANDKLVRYASDHDESTYPVLEAKSHKIIKRVDGQTRFHTPFEHICGGNEANVNLSRGADGPSEWISFSNAGQYPNFGEDCGSGFDHGGRRVKISKMKIWAQGGLTIDMSSKKRAWKWCYEGGNVTIFDVTYEFLGARDVKPWPYRCAKSVYQRITKAKEGSPDDSFWTKKNRRSIAKRCMAWANNAREVLVLPRPRALLQRSNFFGLLKVPFLSSKVNRLDGGVETDREPIERRLQCYHTSTDRCVSLDRQTKQICCCSQSCSKVKCAPAVG